MEVSSELLPHEIGTKSHQQIIHQEYKFNILITTDTSWSPWRWSARTRWATRSSGSSKRRSTPRTPTTRGWSRGPRLTWKNSISSLVWYKFKPHSSSRAWAHYTEIHFHRKISLSRNSKVDSKHMAHLLIVNRLAGKLLVMCTSTIFVESEFQWNGSFHATIISSSKIKVLVNLIKVP